MGRAFEGGFAFVSPAGRWFTSLDDATAHAARGPSHCASLLRCVACDLAVGGPLAPAAGVCCACECPQPLCSDCRSAVEAELGIDAASKGGHVAVWAEEELRASVHARHAAATWRLLCDGWHGSRLLPELGPGWVRLKKKVYCHRSNCAICSGRKEEWKAPGAQVCSTKSMAHLAGYDKGCLEFFCEQLGLPTSGSAAALRDRLMGKLTKTKRKLFEEGYGGFRGGWMDRPALMRHCALKNLDTSGSKSELKLRLAMKGIPPPGKSAATSGNARPPSEKASRDKPDKRCLEFVHAYVAPSGNVYLTFEEAQQAARTAAELEATIAAAGGRAARGGGAAGPAWHEDPAEGVVREAEGLQLHLSEKRSATGYRCVYPGWGEYPFIVRVHRAGSLKGSRKGEMVELGQFKTKVEAAVCFAKHVQRKKAEAEEAAEEAAAAGARLDRKRARREICAIMEEA
eukprot:1230791-Prymnesium_polylepis.1